MGVGPSWSCDPDISSKLSFPCPMAMTGQAVFETILENNGHTHVSSPGTGENNPQRPEFYISHQDNMSVCFIHHNTPFYIVILGFTGVYIIFLFLL